MIKHCVRSRFSFRTVLILGLFQLVSVFASAQCSLSDYVFTKSTGTFTPISGSTKLPVVVTDDASSTAQPIGFEFFYAGRVYNNFYMNSNGYVALVNGVNTASPVAANIRNTANSNTFGSNPILFPLFGDLLAATTTTPAGDAAYILEGTAPNRVLTIQWLNWKWGWSATAPSVSFQAKIYEGTNKIEYVYKPGTVAPNLPVSIGMSAPTAANAASYLSANALSTSATVSGSVFTTTIQPVSVVDGLTYTFTPPALAVTITQQPSAGAVFKAGDAPITITTAASASSALSYQWQQSADNGVTWANVFNNATFSNATTASLTITNPASTLHKYLYRCQITAASSSCPNYTSIFTLGIYQGYTVINDLGGVAQSPLNDLRISIGAGGQIQVKRNSQNQVFDPAYIDAATTPVTRLFNGVFLTVGTTVFGPSNTPATNATTVTPFVTVSHTGGSMTGDGRDVLVLKATKATKDYIITLTYDYLYPNSYFNIQYKVDVPVGNTERVKLYHIIDTYLQGGDAGPAYIQGKPPYLLMGVTKAPTFEAFRYVSGLVWTGYYSSTYSTMYSTYLKNQTNFDNILNYVTTTDNGIGWMYDFGASTAAGSYNFSSDLVFELPPLPTITTQPTDQIGCVNTPVTFSTATSTPNALFSWQVSTNGGTTYTDLADNGTYSGTATANLVLMPTSAMSTYKYRCIIYTAPGWNAAYTNAATLTVNPVTTAGTPIVSLTTSNFCRNNSYDLTVTNPVNAMTYIWKKDGAIISGATSATYSTTQTGAYAVQFSPSGYCPGASSTPITVVANVICTDTDGDGVNDALDLDDDNDGVLDTTEQYCTTIGALTDLYGPTYWKSIAWTGGAYLAQYSYATPDIYIDGVLNNGVEVFRPGTVANPIAGDDFTATPIIFTLELKNPMHADGFSIVNDYGAAGDNILKADIKLFSGTGSNTILLGTETVDNMADVASTTRYPFSKGYDNINTIQIVVYKTLPAGTQAANGMQMGELGLYSNPGTFCNDLDTDGDGIPNRLDLDSDGDGCPDALESGIPTAILTSGTVVNLAGSSLSSGTISSTLNNAVVSTVGTASATFGNNGYANAVETASESGIYSGTYTYQYAKWKSYASCLDTDGDGIPDITDIDDDNDGILDAVESPNCFSSITDAVYIGAITSNLTQYSTYAIGQSIDQNASTASAFSTGQNWVGQEIFRMTPAVNGALKISGIQFDLLNWGLSSATTSTFKLQGSNNAGSSWTDLSVATYSTATTGTFTINNTLQTATAYSLYRLVGVAGTNGYGGVTEIRLMPTSDYVPSMHQIYTCTLLDTDGDGIPNTIDLDSDGDGCPDAKETGIIGTLTAGTISNMGNGVVVRNNNIANTIATGAYGANGFANALETGSETGIYTSTYYYDYAITATLNACADSDGDGVSDLIDLDNDNDGILNAVESPTCYYSLSELATPNDVSSDLTPYSSYAIGQSIDGSATTASGFATGQNWVDKEIFKFTADTYIAITGMSLDLINWALSSATASTFKLQGSTDNMYWKDLSAAVYSTATSGTFTIANTLAGTTKFKYFRLIGVAGTSGYGGVSEARFNLIASTNASANPKSTCNNDTDGDGIFNQNDLDSDGDGCPDAIEAGTAPIGTSAFGNTSFLNPATTGANGFANILETATESGIYSGTYKYIRALSSAISACLDSDGDGVSNIDDIDDDNDGVLDIAEMNCTPVVTNATCLATPQAFGITTHCSGWNGFDYDPSPSVTIISNFDYMGLTSGIPYFDFQGSVSSSATTQLCGKMYKNYTTIPGMTYTFSVNLMSSFVDAEGIKPYLKGVDASTGYELGATYLNGSGVRSVTFTAIGTTTTITLGLDTRTSLSYTGPNQFWYEAGFTMNGATYQTCTIADTDNDGIPNYLDVDSDGDGCPDAVEAQTTYVSTSGVASSAKLTTSIIPGPYGTNGFANGLETVTDNGIYTSTYTYNYATDATINACTDSDGDGIPDAIDLDDDNDGILDTIEENCTVSITSKTGLIITKPSTINYTFNSNTITNLIDGVDNNVYVTSAPTGTLSNSPWFNFQFPTPKTLTYLEIGHYTNQYLFATTSTYKIQGSNDNSTWNDVTGTLTYNNVATSTSGGLSTNNSNIANFPSNRTAYTYYRIYGIAATAGAGWATEIYFKETNCLSDVDGDGIPNKLDTDSDGDGCPDAVEAGTTYISTSGITGTARVTASTIPAPYGANGFANGLETTSESGIYTGSYTYGYALDATINACTDTDGDGVPDILDLDDDNDGVLDTVECPASAPYTLYTYNYPATTIASNVPVNITGMSSQDVLLDQRTNGVAPNAFTYNSITNWKLVASNIKPSAANTITVKIAPTASTAATYVFADAMLITNGVNTYVIDNNTTNTGGFNLTGTWSQQNVSNAYAGTNSYLTSPAYAGNKATWTFSNIPVPTVCDSDGDGIPNRLDLDSDGDGCPDAVEAGTTYISTSGVSSSAKLTTSVIPGLYGANGFANGLETATESGLYTVTYTYNYSLDATINACTDSDGDGVPDIIDLDDDNDGVIDTEECNVALLIDQNAANVGKVSRKSWTLAYIIEQDVNSFAGTTFGALRAECTQNVYGEVKLPPATTPVIKEAITTLDIPSADFGTVVYREVFVKIPSTTAFKNATQISFRIGKDNLTWNAADLYVAHNGASITAATPAGGGGGSTSVLVTTNRNDLKLVSQGKYNGTGGPYYQGGALITSPANAGKWVRMALSIQDGAVNEQASVQYSLNGSTTWLPVDVANGFQFSATEFSDALDGAIVCDTDGDGIPNSLDLDSDGDGCPDAKESGVNGVLTSGSVKNGTGGVVTSTTTIANAIAAGPYGNNGLANGVETATESGVVTYTSTYSQFALVADLVSPNISVQPLNKTVFVGGSVVLTTTAGTPPANRTITYQWYKAGVAIAGATSATYTVTSSATTSNADNYYCQLGFVNSCLTTNTNTVNVTVLSNPVGLTACQDANAILTVTKTGTNTVTYQWKKATTNLVNGANVSGATTATLALTNLTLSDAGAYTLVATDGYGNTINSLAGTISITNNTKYAVATSTTICATTSTINLAGGVVSGTTGATSTKWQRSLDGGATWVDISASLDGVIYSNFTTGTLSITATSTSTSAALNGYQYRIATSNGSCTNYSNIETLNIGSAPTITAQPSNSVLCNTFSTSFTAAATGANLTYQWQTRPSGTGPWTKINAGNATTTDVGVVYSNYATATLNLSAAPSSENNNQYQVVFSNSCGTITSTIAILNPTVVTPTLTGANVSVCSGTPVTLSASSSTASPTYQWYLGGVAIGGATNAIYNPTASGNYSVIANATGYCSSATAGGTVTINPPPTVTIAEGSVLSLSGGSIQLTASAAPTSTYSYIWYNNGVEITGQTTNVLSVTATGTYTVKATNTVSTCNALSASTVITALPTASASGSTTFCQGGSVIISTSLASGATQIQWINTANNNALVGSVQTSAPFEYKATTAGSYAAQFLDASGNPIGRSGVVIGTNTTPATDVIVNPLPTATIANTAIGTTLCAGTNAVLTATTGASNPSIQWYNNGNAITGATSNTYTATGSGIYSFNVTDGTTTCSAGSATSTVTVVNPPAAPNLTATAATICVNASADLTVYQPQAVSGVVYEWHTSSVSPSPSNLVANPSAVNTAGTYYLFAKNSSAGCYSTASVGFTLTITSVTTASLTSASSPIYLINDFSSALNAATTNPTYTLRWYAAATGGVALSTPLVPSTSVAGITNYYVEQYDPASFCASLSRVQAVVTVKPLAPTVSNIVYCQNATAVALTAIGATGASYNWYTSIGGSASTTAPIPATSTTGTINYYVSQVVNGVESAVVTITATINPATVTPSLISGNTSVTALTTETYSVTNVANTTYIWTVPSFMSGTSITNSILTNILRAGSGTVSVIATDASGCPSVASTTSVITAAAAVTNSPTASSATYVIGDPNIPANTSGLIAGTSGATINYYSNPAGSSSTTQSIPATPGVYTFYVSQTINGVESALVPYTITIKPAQPTIAALTYCQNDIAVPLTATGTLLKWYTVSTGGTATTTAPTPSTGTATNTTYYVSQTVGGVESDRIASTVTVNPTPSTPSNINGLTTVVAASSGVYSLTNDVTATEYNWTLPTGWSGTSTTSSINATIGTSGGQIIVTALNGACASPASTLSVVIAGITNPPVTTDITFVTGNTPSSISTNTSALITPISGATLNYYTNNTSGTASATSQSTPTTPGVYTYYVSQTIITGGLAVESILVPYTITVKPTSPAIINNIGIVGNAIVYCKNTTSIALTATASANGAIKWYSVATGGTGSALSPTPSTSAVGTTSYFVSQIVNGVESDRAEIIVTVNDLPGTVIASANSQPTCSITSGSIIVSSPLGTGFTYSADGITYTSTILFNALPSGTYYVTAKNTAGCISAPTTVVINAAVVPPLAPVTSQTQPTCASATGSITVNVVNSNNQYSIDGGLSYQTSNVFNNVIAGSYNVTVKNEDGCISSASTAIINTAPPIPSQPNISSSASGSICVGTTVTLTSSDATGNQWYKDGVLIAGANNQTFTPSVTGNYTVVETNATGCSSIASPAENVTFNALPVPSVTEGATLAFNNCSTSTLVLTATNANATTGNSYQWFLNGNAINLNGTNATYNATQAGSYSVAITNNGCTTTSPISKVLAAPSLNAPNTSLCVGGNASITISGVSTGYNSPVYQWQISTDGGATFTNATGTGYNTLTYNATVAGKYQLVVTEGSTATTATSCAISVTEFPKPVVLISSPANPYAACAGSSVVITAIANAGTASYTYQWLNSGNVIPNATNTTYTTSIGGDFGIQVTDANGCQASAAPINISILQNPAAPTVVISNPTCSVNTGTISVTAPLGTGFTYSIDGSNYTNTTGLFTGVLPGTYSVTVKSSTGCTSLATTATIAPALVVPAQPASIVGTIYVAANSLNTYSVPAVFGATSYTWTVPGNWSGASITNSITIKVDGSDGIISVVANSATCSGPARVLNIFVSNTTPDIDVANINVPVSGNLSTNDLVPAGSSYGQPASNPSNPNGGNITVNSNGTYTFTGTTPGKYTYYVPVCAPGQTTGCPLTALEITVLEPVPPTDKPVANNDAATTAKATPVTVNILANDAAGNPGGTLNSSSVTIAVNPAHGSVVVNSDGTITYTPSSNFLGSDSVTYRVCDNSSPTPLCQTAVVYFTVNAANAPAATTAVDDYASVSGTANGTGSVTGNVLTNDTNTAGGTLSATVVTGPTSAQGTFTLNANGTYTFTPAPGYSGTVDIIYQACSNSGVCEKATLHILVDPAPIIAPDFTSTSINIPVSGSLATNDVVPAGTTYGQPGPNPNNPTGGTIVVNPDGTYTFTGTTPGKYTYYVPVCAPGQTSNCPLSPIEITVVDPLAASNKPIANNDIATTTANTATTVDILANDKAGNIGGTLNPASVAISVQPSHGTVTVNSNGSITYTPTSNFVGTDSVTYSVCDNTTPTPICQTAVAYFTVKPVTAAPTTTAADDFTTVVANTNGTATATGSVLTNDKNSTGAALTASIISGPSSAQGSFTMNANGTYTFTPTVGFSGPVDITYTACTGATPPVCSTATLHILVEPAPIIAPDANATDINVPVSGNLSSNDKIPAGSTYGQPGSNPSNPTGATLVVNPNGTYTFTATTPGKYIYEVPVCAPGQTTACPLTPLEITVLDPSVPTDLPIATNDIAKTPAGSPVTVNVLANDKAGNNGGAINPASEAINVVPTHGTAVINSDGTITYTPASGFVGTDSSTYTICDNSSPALCNTAVVYFTVNPVSVPTTTTANDDIALVIAGRTVTGNVLTNDINSGNASLTASLISGPTNAQGTFTMNADGTYTFTPTAGFTGPVDITYKACDGSTPPVCSTATLHILVEPNPNTSTILLPDVNVTNINVPVNGNLSTNDQLVSGTYYGQPGDNPNNPTGGVITVSSNGTYTFTATVPGTYIYYIPVCAAGQISGCPLSPLEITVLDPAVINAPVANTDIATVPANASTTINVLANDKAGNFGATLNPSSVTIPVQPAHGTVTVNTDGSITYTPTAGYTGADSVIYNVCDNATPANCKNAVVYFTVTPSNAQASTTAADDYTSVLANATGTASVAGNVLSNDKNSANAPLTATLVNGPTITQGTFTLNANGTYNFTPATGFSGPVDITYTVCSAVGDCATATLHILVAPAPILNPDLASAYINIPTAGNISTNDVVPAGTTYGQPAQITGATITVGPNGTYSFTATAAGTYTYTVPVCAPGQSTNCPTETLVITVPVNTLTNDAATAYVNIPSAGNISTNDVVPAGTTYGQPAQITGATITVGPNGTYTFTATAAGTYTYTVPVCAPGQTTNCPTETLVITVPVNTLVNDAATAYVNIPTAGNISTNDVVPAGTTYGQPAQITGATITVNPDGTYSFTATAAGTYTYTVPVCAPGQTTNCPTETLVITVPVNTLTNDATTAYVNIPTAGNVSTNDVVPAGTTYGQPAQLTGATITVNGDGTYSFTATTAGTYTYTVPVCAPGQTTNCPTETLVIVVTDPTPPPPVINIVTPDFGVTDINVPVTGSVATNDQVPTGTTYGQPAANATNPTGATIVINPNGTYTFNATKVGTYTYYVPVCTAGQTSGCPLVPLVITVSDPLINTNPPIANPDVVTTIENTAVTTNVLANDKASNVGVSLNPASVSIVAQPKHGTVIVNSDGTISYTPTNGFVGTDSLSYNVCDNNTPIPNCKTAYVYYTVKAATAPAATVAADDFARTFAGSPIGGNVLSNDKNTAGAPLTVTGNSTVPASKGTFVMNANGTYTFVPAPGFTGPVDITYTVCGGTPSVCTNATLHLLVEPVIPTKILDITKVANDAKMNMDGSFNLNFIIKVKNLTSDYIDSVLVKDDLTKVFTDTRGISIVSLDASGKLVKNINYNGISNTDLLLIQSALDAKKEDSISLTINVASNLSGNFQNTAIVTAPTLNGLVNLKSTDPNSIVSAGDTTRKPTEFIIPKVDVVIPGGFSPNNDGIDDTWVIKRPFGTIISVRVFNRWGNEVFSNSNYQNDWRGKGVSNFIGEDVPEGTYFYIVEATDANNVTRKFASSLTLVR